MQSSQFLDGPVMANLSLVNLLDHRVTHRGGVGGGGPEGVPGKNASVGVVGGGPSGVLGDIGGVAGNGHTKTSPRQIPIEPAESQVPYGRRPRECHP